MLTNLKSWKALKVHSEKEIPHLAELVKMESRFFEMSINSIPGLIFDFTHQRITNKTIDLLLDLATETKIYDKIQDMFLGRNTNFTENRPVLHMALRSQKNDFFNLNGECLFDTIKNTRDKIEDLARNIRTGKFTLSSGKTVKNVITVGIGGSYLGTEAVYEALLGFLREEKDNEIIKLRFLANVDPLAFSKAIDGINAEETIVIVISKTFTTAETLLNAHTIRKWFEDKIGKNNISKHFFAVTSNSKKSNEFGIPPEKTFNMWDWVGGRFSVTSAVGILPLSIAFGNEQIAQFLNGARSVDINFRNSMPRENVALLMGLLGVWNSSFLNFGHHAIVPYSEALSRFPAHVQQVDMESNGKSINFEGKKLEISAGEIVLGEPGTNAQHSFFQLMHQGRIVPVDFIGFSNSKNKVKLESNSVSNHDELMSNFFAQADALAIGKFSENGHQNFEGNRPSLSLLFKEQNAFSVGQLIALYEHKVAVQGFVWGINSFDQFGVQLGKELGKNVRSQIEKHKGSEKLPEKFDGMSNCASKLFAQFLQDQK